MDITNKTIKLNQSTCSAKSNNKAKAKVREENRNKPNLFRNHINRTEREKMRAIKINKEKMSQNGNRRKAAER